MNPADPRECGSCGATLVPAASFCRACGAHWEQVTCVTCGSPIAPGASFCRACGAPVAGVAAREAATVVRTAPDPAAPGAPPSAPRPAPRDRRRTPVLIALAIVLLGAGAASAIVLAGGGSSTTTVAAEATAETGSVEAAPEAGSAEPEPVPDALPAVSRSEMEAEIHDVLLAFHRDVVEHDFRSAWALLSARKRRQNLAEYGYREWKHAQATLSDDLSPSGLRVRIDSFEDKGDGVARVMVTGMGWSAPSSPCVEWSGLTWVRYERGRWSYDPGYSTTSARRRAWESRAAELLGAGC